MSITEGDTMLKIGEFAKLCGVSVQTLRYYDEVGVLCAEARMKIPDSLIKNGKS